MRTRLTPSAATLTLGRLAKASGLARASLLHYEQLGLLLPQRRSAAGYRLYGEEELQRLRQIRRLREAGLSLAEISTLLRPLKGSAPGAAPQPAALLEARLRALLDEMEQLRAQQRQLARLLALPDFRAGAALGGKAAWVALLRQAGFDEPAMAQWHAEFEADSPAEHASFLRALGLAPTEVAAIRRRAKSS